MSNTVFSGEQMADNVKVFTNINALSDSDLATQEKAVVTVDAEPRVDCTGCRRCMEDCPLELRIPDLINLYNDYLLQKTVINLDERYKWLTRDTGKAGDCAGCRVCEGSCKNQIKIYETIKKIAKLFE